MDAERSFATTRLKKQAARPSGPTHSDWVVRGDANTAQIYVEFVSPRTLCGRTE
jgi:hypothetical protein